MTTKEVMAVSGVYILPFTHNVFLPLDEYGKMRRWQRIADDVWEETEYH